jgi:hypothetical protein
MKINWFFGPHKQSFVLDENDEARAQSSVPFHGIVSRGMLALMHERGISPDVWRHHAHLVHLNGHDELCASRRELDLLRSLAAECKALSFGQSAACVQLYLEHHDPSACTSEGAAEVWSIKEGHTSSVWKITLPHPSGDETHFIVNVARDQAANAELEATFGRMQKIGLGCPDIKMAGAYDIQTVHLPHGHDVLDVTVTRNEWLRDAYEIHAMCDAHGRPRQYLLVEQFITAAETPAHIVSILGRRFTAAECRQIENDMARFVERASQVVAAPELNVNEGDLVWNGREAVVVAIS